MYYTDPPKKMIIINILAILRKYTDKNHRLSAKEIGARLERDYSQKVDRKAIKRNLMNLLDFGYDINYTETTRINKNGEEETLYSDWYLGREFTDGELRLLIDSLLCTKRVPRKQCMDLIGKLGDLSSVFFKPNAGQVRTAQDGLPENKEFFYTTEVLDEAIASGKRVSFHYISGYDSDKKPCLHTDTDGEATVFTISPRKMAVNDEGYYTVCTNEQGDDVSDYRIDLIKDIRILEE
jgi:predicted DNA-binding transcriptional regulator YafY